MTPHLFKPLLILEAAVVLLLLATRALLPRMQTAPPAPPRRLRFWLCALSLTVFALYLPAFSAPFYENDWSHRLVTSTLTTPRAFAALFTERQSDGFYRPLTFLSLWVDSRVFGPHLAGFVLQNILIHIANTLLTYVLGRKLNLSQSVSLAAAALFGFAAIHAEPVVWPGARFDLLATFFVLLALICYAGNSLIGTVVCFAAAVLNKEIGFAFLLLAPALQVRRRILAAAFVVAAALLAVRVFVVGGVGGYPDNPIRLTTFYLLLRNTFTLPLFGVHLLPLGGAGWLWSALALGVAALVLLPVAHVRPQGRLWWLLPLLALFSTLPALNVIGWIQPSLQQSRHLYLASVWIALWTALLLEQSRLRRPALALLLTAQAVALLYNVHMYGDVYHRAQMAAAQVLAAKPAAGAIELVGVPDWLVGIFFFGSEVQHQLQLALPGVIVERKTAGQGCAVSECWVWDSSALTLRRRGL